MKRNIYRILITVMTPVIIFAFLTGCASRQQSGSQTTQTSTQKTKETTQTEPWETEQETLTGYTASFKAVIDNTLKECKEKYPDEVNHGRYGLYDFDNDSIPELFLEVYVQQHLIITYIYITLTEIKQSVLTAYSRLILRFMVQIEKMLSWLKAHGWACLSGIYASL